MSEKQYVQCRLRRGTTETTGWIEKRGAKEGSTAELLPGKDLWTVIEVFGSIVMSESMLKEHQLMHRGSLPSVESITSHVGKIPR